jgi:hypothetical protein
MIRAEVYSALQEEFDKTKLKSVASSIVAKAQPLVNKAVDTVQTDLGNYGSADAGVFNIIPESFRQKTAGVVSALDSPLNNIIDSAQSTANQKVDDSLNSLAQ